MLMTSIIIILTLWVLYYSTWATKDLPEIPLLDMIVISLFGSWFPVLMVINFVLKYVCNCYVVYYVAVVTPENEKESE
jgi:hypothetical protein